MQSTALTIPHPLQRVADCVLLVRPRCRSAQQVYIVMSSRMRLRGLIRKEFLQIVRDPSSIAIAFLMPIFLLLLFGYGVSLDSEHIPVALVVE